MTIGHYIANFIAGVFLCNCIPHLVSGLRGDLFPTPFARPSGAGDSSPLVNFFWGAFNLLAGIALMAYRPVILGINLNSGLFLIGFLLMGMHLSHHFGKVRKHKQK